MNKGLLHTVSGAFFSKLSRGCIMAAMIITGSIGALQSQTVDCNVVLACNDLIQVSLGDNCTETLVADMMIEDAPYANSFFTVRLYRGNGALVADNVLRRTMIGETLSASFKLNGCSLSCWGNLTVEDKLPPTITNCATPTTVGCTADITPGVVVPRPTATDACTTVTLRSTDNAVKMTCASPFTSVITRTWTATDSYGNSSTCVQTINIERAVIDEVTFPANFDGPTAIECGAAIAYLPNGAPNPTFSGFPEGVGCANIQYYYEDLVFDLCGNGKKILRRWTVLDWCTGRDTVGNQVIKILDTRPPVCISPDDFTFKATTDPGKCTGTFRVPAPNVTFECSSWEYTVAYKLRDANGQPFVNPITTNVRRRVDTSGYYFDIIDLPQDTSWIIYTITDACGHKNQCFTEVLVTDNEAPSAICEGFSVVTLNSNGVADVFAESIDDHSKDNCEIVKYEIKRLVNNCNKPQNLEFSNKVDFCCADVSPNPTDYIKVVLRVTDKSGLSNECVANVKVDDKVSPTIMCPPTDTIQCGTEPTPATTGVPTGTDNCSVTIPTPNDVRSLNACGAGSISRRWTVVDPGGRTATCTQLIRVIDSTPFGSDNITWPADITINGCSKADADPEILNSLPSYVNVDCADLATSYEDTEFDIVDGCKKISRLWRVIDWCNYTPANAQYITHLQKITLRNSTGPTFTSICLPRTITSPESDCEEYVEHSASAIDDCTPEDLIKYRWTLDANSNSSIDASGNGKFTAGVYPAGTHLFTFIATDLCGNTSSCSYSFTVKDGKAPTPICHREVVWVLDELGNATVWASDFNLKSTDGCNAESELRYAFNEAGTETSRTFTCANVPNGVAAVISLQMYVFDTDGNKEYCDVKLILQDSPNKNACLDRPGFAPRVAGNINHTSNAAMKEVSVVLENMFSNENQVVTTDAMGHFEFDKTNFYGVYHVQANDNSDILKGVSTLDLVHIQRHILGLDKITEADRIIAADINADNKISATDIVALRKAILGITNQYQNNNSWRFYPTNHTFEDANQPWGFPEHIYIDSLIIDQMGADFKGVKIGDVNQSGKINLTGEEVSSRSAGLNIAIDNSDVMKASRVEIPVYADEADQIFGLQMQLGYDGDLMKVIEVRPGALALTAADYLLSGDAMKISYVTSELSTIQEGIVLFTIVADVQAGSFDHIVLAKDGLIAESYGSDLEPKEISLNVRSLTASNTSYTVLNHPNPFQNLTNISFEMSNDEEVVLSVFDVAGKAILTKSINGKIGHNSVTVHQDELHNKAGIYLFKIDGASTAYSGKMIMIK